MDLIVGLDAGKSDLTDAGGITAGSFDIQCDKAETALRHSDCLREFRSDKGADDWGWPIILYSAFGLALLGRFLGSAEQPVKKCHAETAP